MIIETRNDIDFSAFPETDGKPMADNEINLDLMIDLIVTLRSILAPHGHHVGGNLLMYWNPHQGNEHIAPDVFVALDAGPRRRRTWRAWDEGKFPEVVFEIASPSTKNRDIREKVALYDQLGVLEYYVFDPVGQLAPAFRGYIRSNGTLALTANPTGDSIVSGVLGLELRVVDHWLRVVDPASGTQYPTPEEERGTLRAELRTAQAQVAASEARAEQEAVARRAAETRIAQEEADRQAAEQRAAALETELAAMREAMARLRNDAGPATQPPPRE